MHFCCERTHSAIASKIHYSFIREMYSLRSAMNSTDHQVAARALSLTEKVLVIDYYDKNEGIQKVQVRKNTRIRGSNNIGPNDLEDGSDFQNIVKVEKQMISNIRRLHSETLELLRNRKRDDETVL
jgi:hypothetical protein